MEGYTIVTSMHSAGVKCVLRVHRFTPGQIRLIHRFTPNITVLYDGDAAGIKASIRGIDLLLEEGMNIKVVLLPDGEDPIVMLVHTMHPISSILPIKSS